MTTMQLIFLYTGTCMTLSFFAARYLISKNSEYLQILILMFNVVGYVGPQLIFQTNYKGHFYAFIPSIYLYHFYLATLTPSKRHITGLIFTGGAIMNALIAMYRVGGLDPDLIVSMIMSVLFSDLGLRTNQTRLSQMYQMILENEKLAKEKQKVVQQFPHPVLIIPKEITETSECYSNDKFDVKIKALGQKIQELDRIQVTVEKKDRLKKSHRERQSLFEYLSEHQEIKHEHKNEAKWDAIIQCRNSPDYSSDHQDMLENELEQEKVNRNFSIKSLKIEWKGFSSMMHVFIDTTDIINLEQAKNRIKMQKIMFASASHEFRTPLNAIINSFNFIKDNFEGLINILNRKVPANVFKTRRIEDHVHSIFKFSRTGATSSVLLLALVEDVLNLSKFDNGTFVVSYDFFSVPGLLHDVHSLFAVQCENKGVDLIVECDDSLQFCEINTDRNRVRQVLLNLASNANKFTFSGSITLKAALVKTLEGVNFLEFRVCDTGTGIKEEDQGCLFKMFGVIGENEGLNPDGCGLGLTVSKKYVERLGGEIRMKSTYGEGTEMAFTILARDIKNSNLIAPAQLEIHKNPCSDRLRAGQPLVFHNSNVYFSPEPNANECKIYSYNKSKF